MALTAATSSFDSFVQLLLSILIFVFVLAITYFATKWIGNYQKEQLKNNNMQVIETMRVASNKYIQIIRIAEVYLVIAVCKDSVVTLTKLEPEDVEKLQLSEEDNKEIFQEILNKVKNMKK